MQSVVDNTLAVKNIMISNVHKVYTTKKTSQSRKLTIIEIERDERNVSYKFI
jgi:hypothetical protein